MVIKEEINDSLSNQLNYLELYLSNGMAYYVYKPNQDDMEAGQVQLEEAGVRVINNFADGCKHNTFIPYDNIVYVNSIFDCPRLENAEEESE